MNDGGQSTPMPTEREQLDAFNDAHPNCLSCEDAACLDKTCRDCSLPLASEVRDDGRVTGYVHDDCRAHYTALAVRDAIVASLMQRTGAEINELTASERANNCAIALCEMFDVRLR